MIGGAEITSDVILAPEIEMPWESDKVEKIISMPNYATAPPTGHKGLAMPSNCRENIMLLSNSAIDPI